MSTDPNVAHYELQNIVDEYRNLREEGLFEPERRAIERYFTPGSRVLDLGCGAGRTTHALDEHGFDVVGVDASSGMVAAASEADADVQYLVGDASTSPSAIASSTTSCSPTTVSTNSTPKQNA